MPTHKTVPSLTEFAETHQTRRSQCIICELPDDIKNEIHVAKDKRIANIPTITLWLQAQGYEDATKNRVVNHFNNDHRRTR